VPTFVARFLTSAAPISLVIVLVPVVATFSTSCFIMAQTAVRVASCAMGIPAVLAPKVSIALAMRMAIWAARKASAAMTLIFVYSTSRAQASHSSAMDSIMVCSSGMNDSPAPAKCFQYAAKASWVSPVTAESTRSAAEVLFLATASSSPAAVVHASPIRPKASSSASGHCVPAAQATGFNQSGMSMVIGKPPAR